MTLRREFPSDPLEEDVLSRVSVWAGLKTWSIAGEFATRLNTHGILYRSWQRGRSMHQRFQVGQLLQFFYGSMLTLYI